MSSTKPGWLPVVGGPCNGMEMYGVGHLAAGTWVRVFNPPVYQHDRYVAGKRIGLEPGYYSVGVNRDEIVWFCG